MRSRLILNRSLLIIVVFSFALVFNCCKKYDDGGFIGKTNKHLFGGSKVNSSKTWKLKLYEVNGIDSTYLIPGANTVPDFYAQFISFKLLDDVKSSNYSASNYYFGTIDHSYKKILIGPSNSFNSQDSIQCYSKNNNLVCVRNILIPEIDSKKFLWDIKKLTKKEFIITIQLKNFYKIILAQ